MATGGVSEHFSNDLLICTICREILKVPKYLPCLHTFCVSCIHRYIVSSVKEENACEFKCPVCKRCVVIGENKGKPKSWAEQLPENHFVLSLIGQNIIKQEEQFFSACEVGNVSQPAVFWCTVCEEAYCEICKSSHLSFKATAKHEIMFIQDIKEGKTNLNITGNVTCFEHRDKPIEIFCEDHAHPCCTVCATIHHRKCDHVISIAKAASGIKESDKVSELMKELFEKIKQINEVLENRILAVRHFEEVTEFVSAEIRQIRERLNKHLDNIEQRLHDEIQTTKKRVLLKLNDEATELSNMKSRIETWKQVFDVCHHQGSELQCLIKFQEIRDNMDQFDKEFASLISEILDTLVEFEVNNAMDKVESIGQIKLSEFFPDALKWCTLKRDNIRKFNFKRGNRWPPNG